MTEKIRVLVVDDSAFMRRLVTGIVESDSRCRVIKTAKDGVEALRDVEELKPDVVTLDIDLPEIDGITALIYIMLQFPTPVVVVTGYSEFLGDETIKALEFGAVGFVRKPGGAISGNLEEMKRDLVTQVILASQVDMKKLEPVIKREAKKKAERPIPKTINKIVTIASSSGGPRALSQVIPNLPADLAAGVVVVQHMPAEFIPAFAQRLNWESVLDVGVAGDSEPIRQGRVIVAPSDYHCTIESKGNEHQEIKLVPHRNDKVFVYSMANKLMMSLAPIYGKNAIGVVLTGMGNDGTEGLRAIKKHGGYTIAEDESTAVVFGMPKEAIKAGVVDKVVPLSEMADEIIKAVRRMK